MYDPEKGQILIGNLGVNELSFEALRSLITYLPQEPFMLKGSIFDNLKLFSPNRNEAQIKETLVRAGLAEFFKSLPCGYETEIRELGRGLSGGQRQALSLARVFLNQPKIVLLDEPTSWQDPTLERLALDCIEKMTESAIVFIIAHKPSTILSGNKILLLDDGRIIDEGNHQALFARNQIYASYFAQLDNGHKSAQ